MSRTDWLRNFIPSSGVPITGLLMTGFGLLVSLSVGLVIVLNFFVATGNTLKLVSDRTALVVTSIAERTMNQLRPIQAQAEYFRTLVGDGFLDTESDEDMTQVLTVSMSATPQIFAALLIRPDHSFVRVARDHSIPGARFSGTYVFDKQVPQIVARMRTRTSPVWGEPIFRYDAGRTLLNLLTPLWREKTFLGILVVTVTVQELSQYLDGLDGRYEETGFILRGSDQVVAHPELTGAPLAGIGQDQPLPRMVDLRDRVLRNIWNKRTQRPFERHIAAQSRDGIEFAVVQAPAGKEGGRPDHYVFVYRKIQELGEPAWTIGSYFPAQAFQEDVIWIRNVLVAGAVILLVALGIAILSGRAMGRSIRRLGSAAEQLGRVGAQHFVDLAPSKIREINASAHAFNEMAEGLRDRDFIREEFGRFLPRTIAARVLADKGSLQPTVRVATTLFTDIVGFSTFSENLEPEQLIRLMNEYFTVVIPPIFENGGIIHQFQGDAILATFNIPTEDPDHAAAAVRAAMGIQTVLKDREFSGGVALHTRIGINTGPLVGGTVGGERRVGYTVHGDAVNVAARLEALNKELGRKVIVAATTVAAAGDEFPFEYIGEVPIRGKQHSVEIYGLNPEYLDSDKG